MADDKKDDKKSDKPSKSSGGPSDLAYFLMFMLIIFLLWVFSGGPERHPESRTNQFIRGNFTTYHEPIFGQPGSVTENLPFLK